jgi:hypothetical protein
MGRVESLNQFDCAFETQLITAHQRTFDEENPEMRGGGRVEGRGEIGSKIDGIVDHRTGYPC